MRQGIRVLIGAVLGLALTVGLLVGLGTPAMAEATDTGWIAGKVTNSSGAVAAGMVVTLYTIDESWQRTQIAQTKTHRSGGFWLGSQPVGTYYLLVTDPTQDDAPTWWPTPAGQYRPDPFELTTANAYAEITMNVGLDISGVARFNGEPQEGVRVCAGGADVPCVLTDASGAYTARGIAEGYYKLVADPVGDQPYVRTFYPSYTEAASVLAGPYRIDAESAKNSWDFTLQAPRYIAGTVVSKKGAAIAGASVCVMTACVTSGADGGFRMGLDLGVHNVQTLTVTAPGYQTVSQPIAGDPHDLRIEMEATPSDPTTPVTPTSVTAVKPKIIGKTKVGARLTAKAGAWGPTGVELSYQWYRNGHKVSGATKTTYRLTWRDWRKKVTVKVTGKLDGYVTVTKVSKPTVKIRWR